jgi:zinc protease
MMRSTIRRRAALAVAIAIAAGSLSVRAAVRPPKLDYELFTLPNGLTVVLSEDRSTPIVHVTLWYHVGSKNERPGSTG